MLADKTYTPLRADFDTVMDTHFAGCSMSAIQRKMYEMVFFAAAASVYDVMTNHPQKIETLRLEIMDHAELLERQGL
ncbi:hypothetical protein EV128_12227 [Rhizobium azibense]|nr:hypothetical protein EV128_12227 [Rhizobium azibense]